MQSGQTGIITGCDQAYEWMLKWWWSHYSKHNDYSVAFCDFGMSKSARIWCASKGTVITVSPPKNFISDVDPALKEKWKLLYPYDIWSNRLVWFSKPLFLLHTPFENTIWIDVDCEVKKNIAPLFKLLKKSPNGFVTCEDIPNGIRVRKENGFLLPGETAHSTGVMAYTKTSPIIKKWVENCLKRNHLFFSEQDALSRTIFEGNFEVTPLPRPFHYVPYENSPTPDEIAIYHHPFFIGKNHILQSHTFE